MTTHPLASVTCGLPGLVVEVATWFGLEGRDLPWRRTRDPWAVLVAELMLQ